MKNFILPFLALTFATPLAAHEIWVERDAAGNPRIYLGEPADPVPANGDPEFAKLIAPKVFVGHDIGKAATIARKGNHIEANISSPGDVRVYDNAVFAPWKAENGDHHGVIYYARAGRTETHHALDFELVPVAAGSDTFTITLRGKPLGGAKVNIVSPDRWQKSVTADAAGQVIIPSLGAGRYILVANHEEEGKAVSQGKDVTKIYHITTLTYTAS